MIKKIFYMLILLCISLGVIIFYEDIRLTYNTIIFDPCSKPVTYHIGRLDKEFNLSKEEFLLIIKETELLWEQASGRNLFEYSTNGTMAINLIYDERQEGTNLLNTIEGQYNTTKAEYESTQEKYDQFVENHNILMQQKESLISEYSKRYNAYEKEVNKWNNKKVIPPEIYEKVNKEKNYLNELSRTIINIKAQINSLVDVLNLTGNKLNSLGEKVNTEVNTYNQINHTFDDRFEQGVYISSLRFKEINIYQFDNRDRLVRVLAHELGHALGIGHLDDPEDIMHPVNVGKSKKVTANDLNELERICSQDIYNRLFKTNEE